MEEIKKAVILNDTRRNAGHVGCETVMSNIFFLCTRYNIEILSSYQAPAAYLMEDYIPNLKKSTILIVNGEGTFHHDQKEGLEIMKSVEVAKSYGLKCYLINTVWQENRTLNPSLLSFNKIFVRESLSYLEIKDFCNSLDVTVVPDLSLYYQEIGSKTRKDLNCRMSNAIFIDNVNWKSTKEMARFMPKYCGGFFSMDGNLYKNLKTLKLLVILLKKQVVPKILTIDALKAAQLVVSGRFHGLCLAMKYNIPCLSIESNTFKQKGLLLDVGLSLDKYIIDRDVVLTESSAAGMMFGFEQTELEKERISQYVSDAQVKIENMFAQLD